MRTGSHALVRATGLAVGSRGTAVLAVDLVESLFGKSTLMRTSP